MLPFKNIRTPRKKIVSTLFLLALLLLMEGCSNITFQPSKKFFYDPQQFGFSYDDVYFESIDGTRLHGWLFPAKSDVQEKGTVIQFHGNAENITTHFMSLVWLANQGYNLFIFDYRGYGKSKGSPSHKKVNNDALAALEYVVNLKKEKISANKDEGKHKLIAYGQSIGGAILLRAMHDFKDKGEIDAIIAESTFPSYQKIAKEKLSLTFITWPFQPLAYILFSDRYAPEKVIGDITPIPFLVIHGDNDIIIPYHHGEKLFELAGEPKWLWRVKGGRHIAAMTFPQYREKLLHFLESLGNVQPKIK